MIEVVLQGQTLKANLLNPEVSKRHSMKQQNAKEDLTELECSARQSLIM